MSKFKSIPNPFQKSPIPTLVAPKRPSKPPTKLPTPKLVAPKRPSKPPIKKFKQLMAKFTPKLVAPKRPSKLPTKLPTPKLVAPKRPSKLPKKSSPKHLVVSLKKIASPTSKQIIASPTKKVASPTKGKKVASPTKGKKVASPTKGKKVASPTTKEKKEWPALDIEEIHQLQKYAIMNPREVWGQKINNMKDATFVEKNVPKFKIVLDILRKEILPSTRKPIVGKALVFIKNKKDGIEALATYLTNVGKMKPIRGMDKRHHVTPGDNLLIMGELGDKSLLHSYGVTSIKASKGIISKFNEPDNIYGTKYPVMLVHEHYMEGLDLNGITHIILVQDPGTPGMFDQIIGRGVRNCSHVKFPSSLWKVKIISLVNDYTKPTPDEVLIHNRERVTTLVDQVMKTSQEYSLDCGVSQTRYGHKCA